MDCSKEKTAQQPLLSVIVPVYNGESTIERCLRSVLCTQNIPLEILVVDDGSTDQTNQICNRIAASDPRIIYLHKSNGGVGSARNVGIDIAKGRYLTFLDSDDTISFTMYNKLLMLIQQYDADCVMCNCEKVFEHHSELKPHAFGSQIIQGNRQIREAVIAPMLEAGHPHEEWLPSVWNKLYRAELIRKHNLRFSHLPRAEDWLFNIEFFTKIDKIVFTPDVLYQYHRTTEGSLSKSWKLENFDNALWIQDRLNQLFPERYTEERLHYIILDIQANELLLYTTCCGLKGFYNYTTALFRHKVLRETYREVPNLPKKYQFPKQCIDHDWQSGYYLWCIWSARISLLKHMIRPFYRKTMQILYRLRTANRTVVSQG